MADNAAAAMADEEPKEPYQPLLTAEEREELRREWLARLALVDPPVAAVSERWPEAETPGRAIVREEEPPA
jgi:hypothetical protein